GLRGGGHDADASAGALTAGRRRCVSGNGGATLMRQRERRGGADASAGALTARRRGRLCVDEGEDVVDRGKREEALSLGASSRQAQASAVLLGAHLGFEERPQAGRVDERDAVDVERDQPRAGRLSRLEGGFEQRRGRQVELAVDDDDEVGPTFDGRDGEQLLDRRSLAFGCPVLPTMSV
ncbi:MAG TPA: hypothetical protein VHW26_02755, partial [Solirubrobacteraceae bacterium]|nr:hypothetical protein [Solirubrobacteraceae bacterium]